MVYDVVYGHMYVSGGRIYRERIVGEIKTVSFATLIWENTMPLEHQK